MAIYKMVARAQNRPNKCVMLPALPPDHPKGFFDSGMKIGGVDPHGYVSVHAVEEMAAVLGWLSPAENEDMCNQLAAAHEKIMQQEEELNEASNVLDAIDSIESVGFRARKKPGRKPKKLQDFEETPA